MEAAANVGRAHNALRAYGQYDPYSDYFGKVADAGVCGVATVQGDSTATSVREISEAAGNWIDTATRNAKAAWSDLCQVVAEASTLTPYDLRRIVGAP